MDFRERSYMPYGWVANEERMKIKYEGKEYDATFHVCPKCKGRGKYVNPSIDSGGISADEFYSDPDFAEAYIAGRYDIQCSDCHGQRVVLKPALHEAKAIEEWEECLAEMAETQAMYEMERRMGC